MTGFSLLAGVVLFLVPAIVHAHAVGLECKVEDKLLTVEAFFDDGTPARKSRVKVVDGDDRIVAEGQTDRRGVWSCPVPDPGKYQVHLDAGAGHLARATITIAAAGSVQQDTGPSSHTDHPPATAPQYKVTSNRPDREAFTAFPWAKAIVGVVAIGLLAGAMLVAVRLKRTQNTPGDHPSTS